MKTIVSLQDLNQIEIKPSEANARFLELVEQDCRTRLAPGPLAPVDCPGCVSPDFSVAFPRFGLEYVSCDGCGTLYVRERPSSDALDQYYSDAESVAFWEEEIYRPTLESRREKLAAPLAQWVLDSIAEKHPEAKRLVDLSTHGALLRSEIKALGGLSDLLDGRAALAAGDVDVVTAFDCVGRTHNLPALIKDVHTALRPGGLMVLTAPAASGLEPLVLWDRSPTIMPPDKLNLLTVEGFEALFSAPEWEIVELSTPGLLDLEIIRHVLDDSTSDPTSRFLSYLFKNRPQRTVNSLVEFLQINRLASHVRLVARKAT
jgi:SAM-dependent methyltransferase